MHLLSPSSPNRVAIVRPETVFGLFLAAALLFVGLGCTANSTPSDASSVDASSDEDVVLKQVESEEQTFRVVRAAGPFVHPWAVAWLPDGRMLVTERRGEMLVVDGDTKTKLSGVPEVYDSNQGGLLDVRLHPNYEETGWIYFSYSASNDDGTSGTVFSRAQLNGTSLTDVDELFRMSPFQGPDVHYGSRIAFPGDGTVVVTLGERGQRFAEGPGAQDSTNTVGTTIRLTLDGGIPDDNPFVGRDDVPDAVFSYGHRNQQGMAIHPETGGIWQHEHGPHGGDELNLVKAGNNYGWPAVSYGDTYRDQTPIGGTEAPGMTQPVTYWDPSPALSGMTFYTGDQLPGWTGDLIMGALAHQKLIRVELDGETVTHQEDLLRDELGRVRDVATGPDGYLYVLTDASEGHLYRVEPV